MPRLLKSITARWLPAGWIRRNASATGTSTNFKHFSCYFPTHSIALCLFHQWGYCGAGRPLTLSVVPTETPVSVCSLALCWSPVWAASPNTWGGPPPACGSSARSEPARACSAPVLPVFAGSSPGMGKYDRWQISLCSKCQKLCRCH